MKSETYQLLKKSVSPMGSLKQIIFFILFAMEQYIAHQKALTFGDPEIAEKVMRSFDFEEMKAMGRQVRNYNNTVWNGIRQIVVYEGLLAK